MCRPILRSARSVFLALALPLLLQACGGGDAGSPDSGATVDVFTPSGAGQCAGGGASPQTLRQRLQGGGVTPVGEGSCGSDGLAHPAMCGAPDGSIVIFEISADQTEAATRLGFAPLRTLPEARRTPCRPG